MAAPLFPKVYDEDEEVEWENLSHQMLKTKIGKSEFTALSKRQYKDVPESPGSAMSGIGIKLKIRGLHTNVKVTRKGCQQPLPVGGAGFATVINRPKFPHNDFFRPGRHFRVRMRHANLSCRDDRACDGRVAVLKFCDDAEGGPLDLVMVTGRVAVAHNAAGFDECMAAMAAGEEAYKDWCLKYPSNYFGVVDQARHLPESYYDQRYYSQVTYQLIDHDGVRHMARLRLCPASAAEETGRLTPEAQETVWCSGVSCSHGDATMNGQATPEAATGAGTEADRGAETSIELNEYTLLASGSSTSSNPESTITKDYLRAEYLQRLQTTALQYRLQIQTRDWPEKGHQGANPCVLWDVKKHPWSDLAVVTIALPLPQAELCRTRSSLHNHPIVFKLPPTSSRFDFFSLAEAVSEMHGVYEKPVISKEVKRKYVITVKTGTAADAGTDADVSIVITGTKCRTRRIGLDTRFHDDFESGQTDVFEEEAVDVGDVIMVQMTLSSVIRGRHWLLDYVSVTDVIAEKTARFPCYQWLTSSQPSILLRRSDALLAHQELTPYCYLQRKHELEERRAIYQWEKVSGLPSRLKAERYEDIPREARFHQAKERDLKVKYVQTLTNTGVGAMKSMFDVWDPLADSDKLLTSLLKDKSTVKKVAIHWKEDVEFGRQFLNGPHPVRIRQLTRPLMSFPVTDEDVYGLLDRGMGLRDEMKEGHIYVVTYPELGRLVSSINHQPAAKRFVVAPNCMLYVRSDSNLVPIAIQLEQRAGDQPVLYTPKDDPWEWLYAKMWVRLADAQVHQIEARHLKLHLVLEAFSVATMRNLPSVHPVYKLIVPHLRHVIAVNHLGRRSLYPSDDGLFEKYLSIGSHFKELLKDTYRKFDLNSMNLRKNLEDRGVMSPYLLPHYFYRRDGLALWDIIKKFVRTMLMLHYWTNQNVQSDEEIQGWARDLHTNGLPEWEEGTSHNVPSSINTLEELTDLVTMLIFTASGQNAAITAPMMDYYGFPPNAPTMMIQPPPFEKGRVTAETLKRALPSKAKTAEIIAVCYTLSRASKNKIYLGTYPDEHFSGDATLATIEAFREDLKNLTETIAERSATNKFSYPYLSPDRLPASVVS